MGFMSLAALMEKGTAGLLLALLILSVVNTVYIAFLYSTVKGIKDDKLWSNEYKSDQKTHKSDLKAVQDRITRLESRLNGLH